MFDLKPETRNKKPETRNSSRLNLHPVTLHERYMHRCIELAELGAGYVAPNPMVGSVIVHNDVIIGEGYHKQHGKPHAEVNSIASVKNEHRKLLASSTLYVSLEPCAHFGKTPPCTELIIKEHIPQVVIGCRDPFRKVNGLGIEHLQKAGVKVITGVLEEQCVHLNRRFITYQKKRRPYVVLKWAQTQDLRINGGTTERLMISNEAMKRLVHKWRSEEAGIVIGTNTALADDPSLTTRYWAGPSPVRIVIDMDLRLPETLMIFDGKTRTVIFNSLKHDEKENIIWWQITKDVSIIPQMLNALMELEVQSILVEGGSTLLQSFIEEGDWDEARVITNPALIVKIGLPAPRLSQADKVDEKRIMGNILETYIPQTHSSAGYTRSGKH